MSHRRSFETYHLASGRRFIFWFSCGGLTFGTIRVATLPHPFRGSSIGTIAFVVALALGAVGYLALELRFRRIEARDDEIESFDAINRTKFRVKYGDIEAYRPNKSGAWSVKTADREFCDSNIETHDFHRAIVNHAPRALNAKRLKTNRPPAPETNFKNLWMFDSLRWFSSLLGSAVLCLPIWLIFPRGAVGAVGALLAKSIQELHSVLDFLTVDSTGLTKMTVSGTRKLRWEDVTAIFCEHPDGYRQIVVVSRDSSILIPNPLATNREVMRKILCSVPQSTLMVNFTEPSLRRYRKRRRRRRTPLESHGAFGEPAIDLA